MKNPLLQPGKSNTKTAKNEMPTWSLSLAQANLSGHEVCPHRTKGCTEVCVGKAGMAGVFPTILQSRIRKTQLFFNNRAGFLSQLVKELSNANKWCEKHGKTGLVRLNTFSDIAWEKMLDLTAYPNLRFYDYTKNIKRAFEALEPGQEHRRVCYSLNEKSDMKKVRELIDRGGTVAVVFGDVLYNPSHNKIGPLPDTYMGVPVVDGDATDDRFNDPRGVFVGLRLKGTIMRRRAACDTGFARNAFTPLTVGGK